MSDDRPKVARGPTGVPSDVPDSVEERAQLLRDYLRLISEDPENHVGAFGNDAREKWAERAAFAAMVIESTILWKPDESSPLSEMAFGNWKQIQDTVGDTDE